jgi:hypothetical protein
MAATNVRTDAHTRRWWSSGWSLGVWAMVAAMLIPTLGFAVWALLTIARENADGPITAITGTEHTVYHANNALPDANSPRSDDALTLVWFTSSSCSACDATGFEHRVMADYRENVVFVEKAADREGADERLGISSLPAFAWLDRDGNEIGRPKPFVSEAALRAEVERMIASR